MYELTATTGIWTIRNNKQLAIEAFTGGKATGSKISGGVSTLLTIKKLPKTDVLEIGSYLYESDRSNLFDMKVYDKEDTTNPEQIKELFLDNTKYNGTCNWS